MNIAKWSVMSSESCRFESVVDVTRDFVPKDVSSESDCRNTLFDAKMGPRFDGDVCATCNKTIDACRTGHFGIMELGTRVVMSKYSPQLIKAAKGVCYVCMKRPAKSPECSLGSEGSRCTGKKQVKDNKNGTFTVDGCIWTANQLYDFFDKVDPSVWPDVEGWSSDQNPKDCLFDCLLVLSNPNRPTVIQGGKRSVGRLHRYTEAYLKIMKIVARRRALIEKRSLVTHSHLQRITDEDTVLIERSLYEAVNDLFISTKKNASGDTDVNGMLSGMVDKTGLLRNNLMGKRVDFSGRAVAVGDPSLSVDEFGIPRLWRDKLTVPVTVHDFNLEMCRRIVTAGEWTSILKGDSKVRYDADLIRAHHSKLANRLVPGDVVDRWLQDGDPIMMIRQPTLHKGSMMCGKVRLHDRYTIELNVNTATPYNGDFDGDEYNAFVPRGICARIEFEELFCVRDQIVNENGKCQIYPMQNAALGVYQATANNPDAIPRISGVNITESVIRNKVRDIWFTDGPKSAVKFIDEVCNVANQWLDEKGASIGLNEFDCAPLSPPRASDGKIRREQKRTLRRIVDHLNDTNYDEGLAFNEAAKFMSEFEPFDRSMRDMRASGCKGNATNELNVALVVGKQYVCDAAPRPFFGDRILPCELTCGNGFVPRGYAQGLLPEHTAIHQMSGRYGVFTKSVGVKESGQRFRELGQCMENLRVVPGGSVVDSEGTVVQLLYGSDGFDPKYVRRSTGLPVNPIEDYEPVNMVPIEPDMRERAEEFFKGRDEIPYKLLCDWRRGEISYGQAVGIISAQSISEPATQETLNTFHFSGSKTERKSNLKRLFKASKGEIYGELTGPLPPSINEWKFTRERPSDDPPWTSRFPIPLKRSEYGYLILKFDRETDIMSALRRLESKSFRSTHPALDPGDILVQIAVDRETEIQEIVDLYETRLSHVRGRGKEFSCVSELSFVLGLPQVNWKKTFSDDARDMQRTLGIEAARSMLFKEFTKAFKDKVDVRHVSLMVDAMTYGGDVTSMDYNGYKSQNSGGVIGMICFQRAIENLFKAASSGTRESSNPNASSAVITGRMCELGTGAVNMYMDLDVLKMDPPEPPESPVFEPSMSTAMAFSPAIYYDPMDMEYMPSSPVQKRSRFDFPTNNGVFG